MPKVDDFPKWLVNLRRMFHMYPELSFQEHETTQRIASALKELCVEVTTFPDITGVVGLLRGAESGPTMALRSDMDALPLQELNEVPYKSTRDGIMHACGHDAHMAILLGTARKVVESDLMSRAKGNLKFIFQPAEEILGGAKALIERRVLDDPPVGCIASLHVGPHIPAGKIGLYGEQAYASADAFEIVFIGSGTHGARPDEGRDPITASAYFITALQTIVSRNIKPIHAAVVSIGKIHAGRLPNIIPEKVILEGTLRSLVQENRLKMIERLKEIATGISEAFQVSHKFKLREGSPSIKNDPQLARAFRRVAEKVLGKDNIIEEPPTMGGEDFAFYAQRCPAAIVRLGCGNPEKGIVHPLHSPRFDLDERALPIGVDLFFELVRDFFT